MYFKLENCQPDVYLSGSNFFTENTAKAFKFDQRIFIATGLPRNDLLFKKDEKLAFQIKRTSNISADSKVVLYAPTFRKNYCADDYGLDYERLLETLKIMYGGSWVVLYRAHYFISEKLLLQNKNVIDVSQYDDMQELLYISDILISDYSSSMWDFSLMGKPCFVYAPDLETYKNEDRAFAYPVEQWPYPIATSNAELLENIKHFNKTQYIQKVKEHHEFAGCYDQGNAAEKVTRIIETFCGRQ